ncbi:MAG: hypothetical protein MUO27_12030 [Sedimentisphaerales bacterium]|nr:hypothetical protein [Sedimentisphaerales bacterium]
MTGCACAPTTGRYGKKLNIEHRTSNVECRTQNRMMARVIGTPVYESPGHPLTNCGCKQGKIKREATEL